MSGIDSISKGLTSIMNDDANLRNFKVSGGEVKERSGLGKLFTRLSDHFSAKSAGGRLQIAERNATIGDAMLKMVNNRLDAKMGRIDAKAADKGLAPDDASVAAKKENITAMAKTLTDKITNLSQSKDVSPKALNFLKCIGDAQVKEKFLNATSNNVDKKIFEKNLRSSIDSGAKDDNLDGFNKDARRGMLKWPGDRGVKGEGYDLDGLHKYLDDLAKNTPEVKKFITDTCYQSGIPFAVISEYGGVREFDDPKTPNLNEIQRAGIFPAAVPGHSNVASLSARDDGSIDVKFSTSLAMQSTKQDGKPLIAARETIVNIHLPVDKDGNFVVKDGYPEYAIENIEINNIEV